MNFDKLMYSNIIPELLFSVHNAVIKCIELKKQKKTISETDPGLLECFSWIVENKSKYDSHITEGLFPSHQERLNLYPRILKITINSFNDATEISTRNNRVIIPSPLHIVYYSLIIPDHQQTAAYSLAACRALLFKLLDIFPHNPTFNLDTFASFQKKQFFENDIKHSIDSFIRHEKIDLRWPKDTGKDTIETNVNLLVGHFLAMKGILHLWFNSINEAIDYLTLTDFKIDDTSKFLNPELNKDLILEIEKNVISKLQEDIQKITNKLNIKKEKRVKYSQERKTIELAILNYNKGILQDKILKSKELRKKIESGKRISLIEFYDPFILTRIKKRTKKIALLVNEITIEFNNHVITSFGSKIRASRFRQSSRFEELPDIGEINNQLFGIPIPIKGAEIIFFGGFKTSSSGGLVVNISGGAGTGKTSFALAIANLLEPFGTNCLFISLEEEVDDIKNRLESLRPQFEEEVSFFKGMDRFNCVKLEQKSLKMFNSDLNQLRIKLEEFKLKEIKRTNQIPNETPPICPSLIVIDNLNELLKQNLTDDIYKEIEKFIDECRSLNSLVLLISGENVIEKYSMEYLMDMGIRLRYEGIDVNNEKPLRLFNLYKTRHQLAQQGTHVFHMNGSEGIRLSPLVHAQTDKKRTRKRNTQSENEVINCLNYLNEDDVFNSVTQRLTEKIQNGKKSNRLATGNKNKFISLFPVTHILVHGYGSSGKAGFALKILLTPPIENNILPELIKNEKFAHKKYRRKVLIISFLYGKEYYEELVFTKKNLNDKVFDLYKGLEKPVIEYLIFYPGNLSPQDLLCKILRKLDIARLKGEPFTGVLIDGLHNVFLQFPKIQDDTSVWPILYNLLSKENITVVSTFTNFSINDQLIDNGQGPRNKMLSEAMPDHLLIQKGMAPFLHLLVKAADFYFFMENHTMPDNTTKYLLSVKGAINQYIPTEVLEWDRQENVFRDIYRIEEFITAKVN